MGPSIIIIIGALLLSKINKTCGVALALNLIHSFIHGREGEIEREGGGWGQEVLEFSFRREKEDLVITIII